MTRWKPGAAEFVVSVVHDRWADTRRISVPSPVLEKLGNPTHVRIVIRGSRALVEPASK